MREIKFRALDSANNWWIGNLSSIYNTNGSVSYYIEQPVLCDIETALVNKETVGQFTGLKDSFGNEVYEGDILERSISGNDGIEILNYKYRVLFSKGSFILLELNETDQGEGYYISILEMNKYRVIGNIHQDKFEYNRPTTAEIEQMIKRNA